MSTTADNFAEPLNFVPDANTATASRMRLLLLAACPLLFAAIAVLLGKATGWDLRNYHWYNPYAFLTGRLGFDVAVAHHAGYYNPLADVPLYLIATHAPAWMGGAFLGALAGIVVALVGSIAYHVIPLRNERHRLLAAALLALLGAGGAGAFGAIGDPYNDIPAGLGSILALCLLIVSYERIRQSHLDPRAVTALIAAGLGAGAAVGLKLTSAPYACGLTAALCCIAGPLMSRVRRVTFFGIGAAAGLLLFGGYWMFAMWRYGDNPLFPYFNNLFHSNLLLNADYRDPNFHPDTLSAFLLFPFHFLMNSHVSSEQSFRDAHLAILYVLIPLTALGGVVLRLAGGRLASDIVDTRRSTFIFIFAGIAYLAWLIVFAIYRYLIPLEMLMPLMIVAAVMSWPVRTSVRLAITAVLLLGALTLTRPYLDRSTWAGPYVQVQVPELQDPQHSMILMSGYEPMAFVIPSFPADIPFLRIDGWLAGADDKDSGLARGMRERVAAHTGPLYLMFSPLERDHAVAAVKGYELSPALDTGCTQVKSNIADPLTLCRVYKLKP